MPKTNPKRIPRTQADVDKAFMEGLNVGMEISIDIMMSVLLDKHGAKQEELDIYGAEINDLCDSINEGYVNYADIRNTLREDYNFKIKPLTRRLKI